MRHTLRPFVARLLMGLFLAGLWVPPASAGLSATVTQVVPQGGEAWRTPALTSERMPLQLRSPVGEQDLLETGSTTWVQLFFPPACQVWIAPNSKVLVSRLVPESGMSATLQVVIGQVRATIGSLLGYPEQVFGVEAESVYAAPRGTDFVVVREAPGRSQVVVIEGAVELSGQALGSLRLEAGQLARLGEGGQLLGTSSLQIGELQRLGLDASPKQNVNIAAGWMTPVSPRPVSPLPVIPLLPQPLLPGVRADRSGWSVVLEPQ